MAKEIGRPRKWKNPGEAEFAAVMGCYRHRCKVHKIEWHLSNEFCLRTLKMNCHYCGIAPCQKKILPISKEPWLYNGLDRIDNSKGYEEGNVVSCCGQCNTAKNWLTLDEFKAWVNRIYSHLGRADNQGTE